VELNCPTIIIVIIIISSKIIPYVYLYDEEAAVD